MHWKYLFNMHTTYCNVVVFLQRCEVIDLINHETMMAQLKEDMLLDKEKAIQIERDHYEQLLLKERQSKLDEPKDAQVFCYY